MLTFLSTQTVEAFKASVSDATLQVRQNAPIVDPVTGVSTIRSPFFTCGGVTGPVSKKGYSPNPMVSKCVDTVSGKELYMLHSRNDSNLLECL